ncbi:MAG: signal peptidase I [Bdellovibrionota bacterium]
MKKASLKSYFWTLSLAVIFAVVTRFVLITAYKVPTGSMQPTLQPGDFIFASKITYGILALGSGWYVRWTQPQRNEVVVFTYPDQPDTKYVKRVIGMAGDEIKIENDELWINGKKVLYEEIVDQSENPNPESFTIRNEIGPHGSRKVIQIKSSKAKRFGPLMIPEGQVFLLGDNRDASDDSRNWGTVPTENVIAKVQMVWLSLDWQKKWAQNRLPQVRWSRIFSRIY